MTSTIKTIKGKPWPEPYDLSDPDEVKRLFSELVGYMKVSLNHGTDNEGRKYALEALEKVNSGETLMVDREDLEAFVSYAKYASDKGLLIKDGLIEKQQALLQDKG